MKLFFVLIFFLSIFTYGEPKEQNIVKVTINIGSYYFTSYVILSTSSNLNSFYIIKEEI